MQEEQIKKLNIYIPNTSRAGQIGGGWTFLSNIRKALKDKVQFVDTWQECDIVFMFSVTTIDKSEIHNAINGGKKLVLRVDNIPRKSRNRRATPYKRLTEFGNRSALVVYQSEWCKDYAGYFIDNENEIIINNGVDSDIFNKEDRSSDSKTYLYINYNDNPNKRFDEAMFQFEMMWREDNDIKLVIAGNAPRIYLENPEYYWDLNVEADITYAGITNTPEETAELMKTCDYLLYPSFAEAYPNTVLEALACGMKIECVNDEGGTKEAIENSMHYYDTTFGSSYDYRPKTIEKMGEEYLKAFNEIIK